MKKLSILQHSDFGQVRNVVITWTDPYSPEQMDEAVSILKQPRS